MIKFPTHAPLDDAQKSQLGLVLSTLNPQQTAWVSGFLAGSQGGASDASVMASERKLTVLYGTESGNCEELGEKLYKTAKQKGFKAKFLNMSESKLADLKDVGTLLVVVSTWGDGEPPEAAEEFYNELMAGDVSLDGVDFSVCALGDTSYEQFCQTGKDFDVQLEKFGAARIADRVDCDVDYDDSFAAWSKGVWSKLGDVSSATASAQSAQSGQSTGTTQVYDKKNPFPAEILENQLLSGEHSNKETHHVELSLEGSGLTYQVGDVLAVLPRNAEDVVASILNATGLSGDAEVDIKGIGAQTLSAALCTDLDITGISRKVMKTWQEITGSEELAKLLAEDAKEAYRTWVDGRQIIDLLEVYPAKNLTAQQFVDVLRKLPLRLYSIASSLKAHPDEVHLTVAVVRYETHDKSRKGVASTFLADDAPQGAKVSVYIHQNKHFRLPEDSETPVIMVGPGTGIAPFRAFVEERSETDSKGDSWLFVGDQYYNEDFLYQLEWQEHLKNGHLSRMDVAFSRDQPEKVYVQHKLQENAAELWQWLEKGAHFYVCGDASRMAKDVNETLLAIISNQGGLTAEQAKDYLSGLKKNKRYQRDVY